MKTTAIIDLGYMAAPYFQEYFSRIRKETACDNLVVLSIGDVKRNSKFTPVSYISRFNAAKAAGADVIMRHPVTCTSLRDPYFNFSLTSFLNKLRSIDVLVLPVADDTPKALEFARKFENDLKFSYSSIKCVTMQVPDGVLLASADVSHKEASVMKKVQEYFRDHGTVDELMEIFGGTDTIIDHLLSSIDVINSSQLLSEAVSRLATKEQPEEKIRQFLLKCVMGFRKLDHSICAMYEYSPYAHVVFEKDGCSAVTDQIEKEGFIQVVNSCKDPEHCTDILNPSKLALFKMDGILDDILA